MDVDFDRFLARELARAFPAEAASLRAAMKEERAALEPDVAATRGSPNPLDRRLATCADVLALVRAMERAGKTYEEIRAVCLTAAHAAIAPRNRLHAWLKRWPARLIGTRLFRALIGRLAPRVARRGFPGGFVARIVTEPAETFGLGYGVDILECGICKLFGRHGMARYVPILCEVDHLTTSLAGLEMVRTGTIATGAPRCDFRYRVRDRG